MRQEETIRREILEQRIDRELEALSEKLFGKKLEDASDEQVYVALLYLVKGLEEATVPNDGDKKIYYISAEFLIGKLLSNNLINLGIYEKSRKCIKEQGQGSCPESKRSSRSRLLVTVVWDVWLPALWIPLQPWVFPAKASA